MRPHEAAERALAASSGDAVVIANETSSANLRWAGSNLTTNGVARTAALTVVAIDHRSNGSAVGVVSRSRLTPESVDDAVQCAEAAAKSAETAEDAMPLVPGGVAPDWEEPAEETSMAAFAGLAPEMGEAFRFAGGSGHLLYGYAEQEVTSTYLATSTGLALRHVQPAATFELTGRSPSGDRSAWSGWTGRRIGDVDVHALAGEVGERISWAKRRVELPAGRYDTVLPPGAVADLMAMMHWHSDARSAHEGRSVFSRAGGGTRVGDELTQAPLTLRSDPRLAGHEQAPFVVAPVSSEMESVFDNGLAIAPTDWVRRGRLVALVSTRHSAALAGVPVAPPVGNLVLESEAPAGDISDLVASCRRGLLLTCLWYIRTVDERTLLLTGLTRDGVYLVEDGEVTAAVNNFRFNESPVDLLSRVQEAGTAVAAAPRETAGYLDTVMAPLRVADFNMSSVSPAS